MLPHPATGRRWRQPFGSRFDRTCSFCGQKEPKKLYPLFGFALLLTGGFGGVKRSVGPSRIDALDGPADSSNGGAEWACIVGTPRVTMLQRQTGNTMRRAYMLLLLSAVGCTPLAPLPPPGPRAPNAPADAAASLNAAVKKPKIPDVLPAPAMLEFSRARNYGSQVGRLVECGADIGELTTVQNRIFSHWRKEYSPDYADALETTFWESHRQMRFLQAGGGTCKGTPREMQLLRETVTTDVPF